MMAARPHVVIIGGGFGGLSAAKALRNAPVRVTLIDRRNFHLFQPLLYQVATGALSPANIASPLRALLKRQRNAEVLLDEVTGIDVAGRRVLLSNDDVRSWSYFTRNRSARLITNVPLAAGERRLDREESQEK